AKTGQMDHRYLNPASRSGVEVSRRLSRTPRLRQSIFKQHPRKERPEIHAYTCFIVVPNLATFSTPDMGDESDDTLRYGKSAQCAARALVSGGERHHR